MSQTKNMFLTLGLNDSTVDITRQFYERLGCSWVPEKHGDFGLPHFSAMLASVPIEIYPAIRSLPPEDRFFLGFTVESPASVKAELIHTCGGKEVEHSVPTTKSGIATLRDPNGILVRLFPINKFIATEITSNIRQIASEIPLGDDEGQH